MSNKMIGVLKLLDELKAALAALDALDRDESEPKTAAQ